MFYGILIVIHIAACLALIGIVLIQAGRGGGLTESFSKAESIFGTMTNTFLTRATTVLAIVFFITCLSLAFLSKERSKSLLEGKQPTSQTQKAQNEIPSPKDKEDSKEKTSSQEKNPVTTTEDSAKNQAQ